MKLTRRRQESCGARRGCDTLLSLTELLKAIQLVQQLVALPSQRAIEPKLGALGYPIVGVLRQLPFASEVLQIRLGRRLLQSRYM